MIWRERKWILICVGVLFAANLAFFITYRVRFEQRVQAQDVRLEETEAALAAAKAERAEAERELATYRQVLEAVDRVYDEWWATPQERLSPLLIEMRELAGRADLQPRSIQYARDTSEVKRGETSSLSISFAVSGSYDQARRLIHLLELTEQFVIIDEIALGEGGEGGNLVLQLRLRTLFRDSGTDARGT